MLLNISKLSIAGIALMSASAMASTTYVDFGTITDVSGNVINDTRSNDITFNEFYVEDNGITIKVTGWSDTHDFTSAEGGNPLTGDDKITKATDFDRNGNGWSLENKDEGNTSNCGYHHSADNINTNSSGEVCNLVDYDMFLLEFSEAVNISAATSSWLYGQGSGKNTAAANNQITVAALNNNDLLDRSWTDVKADTASSGFSGFTYSATAGYYTSDLTTSDANVSNEYSNFWLIGALNTVFGGDESLEGNDGIKLSSVSFSTDPGTPPPSTTVPEPTSIMMFGLALVGFAASRRKVK